MTAYELKRLALDVLYPNRCPFCNEIITYNAYWCNSCIDNYEFHKNDSDNIAVFEYTEKIKPFIFSIKEGGNGYAVSAAAKLIYDILDINIDLITCIPASKHRIKISGYNPPALVAEELGQLMNIPCDVKLLKKIRNTETQKDLTAEERRENLKGAFTVTKNHKIAKNILLIDDVRATGSTLEEAAEILRFAGAEKVYTAVIAAVNL
ncbi:MAG: double zinc ribbon domain-containing protein [Oscillospiraceae bacterium]|nr:double zinc ribbon domain-containing protein [Oscillospiraceae bacterium]